jgi:hypothetical protein
MDRRNFLKTAAATTGMFAAPVSAAAAHLPAPGKPLGGWWLWPCATYRSATGALAILLPASQEFL